MGGRADAFRKRRALHHTGAAGSIHHTPTAGTTSAECRQADGRLAARARESRGGRVHEQRPKLDVQDERAALAPKRARRALLQPREGLSSATTREGGSKGCLRTHAAVLAAPIRVDERRGGITKTEPVGFRAPGGLLGLRVQRGSGVCRASFRVRRFGAFGVSALSRLVRTSYAPDRSVVSRWEQRAHASSSLADSSWT